MEIFLHTNIWEDAEGINYTGYILNNPEDKNCQMKNGRLQDVVNNNVF